MRNKSGLTPKEEAAIMILDYIKGIAQGGYGNDQLDLLREESSPKFVEETERHLRKLHNRVLDMTPGLSENAYI